MDGVGMASGQRIFGEGREREWGGVLFFYFYNISSVYLFSLFYSLFLQTFFYSYHIHSVYLFPLFYPF